MTETEVMDKLTKVDSIDAKLAKLMESEPKPETKSESDAEMEERGGILDQLTGFEVMKVPVGQALVGGFGAVFVTEVIDGFMAAQTTVVTGITKLVVAGAVVQFAKPLLGKTGVAAASLLIAFDGLRDVLPIDTWAKQMAAAISGFLPSRGLAQGARNDRVNTQANEVASGYYSRMLGR